MLQITPTERKKMEKINWKNFLWCDAEQLDEEK